MPVVNPIMQHLTKALDDPTMVDLILARHEIAKEIQRLTYIKSRGTIDALKADADSTMTLMMLRMNRDVIRSLVQPTIGYDFAKRETNRPFKSPIPKTFSANYRGVYAISIAIRGRNGEFLSKNELLALIRQLEKYLEAAEFRLNRSAWGNTGISMGFQQDIESVDRHFRKGAPSNMPRFIDGPRAATNTKFLIKALKLYTSFPGPGNEFLR